MAGTNYFAEFNTNVKISLTNDDDFAVLAECNGNPNVVATESDRYMPGCIMIRTDYNLGDNLYQNNGTLSLPSWSVIGGGGPVTGLTGSPTQVVYIDNSGNGTGDGLFTRDSMTNESLFGMNQNGGTQTSQFILNETTLFGIPGTNGGGIELVGIDGSAYSGVVNPSAVGAPFNYATLQRASDALGNTALQIVAPGQMFGQFTNGVDATAQISLTANQAGFGIDDSDYGGTDEAYIQVEWNAGLGAQEIVTNFRNGADVYRTLIGSYGVKFDFGGGNTYTFPKVDGSNGQVLTTDGAGNLSWQTGGGGGSITADQIGFGDSSNTLTSTSAFKYYDANNLFEQTVPNNTGNAGTTTSPLSFGPASFTGSGLDDLTLTWNSATYKSNKYGGNLQIQIDSTGSPDTFSWTYTGAYSQIVGTGSNVPITGGPQVLSDLQGRRIAEIAFASDTGHTLSDRWNASTSLSTYAWGSLLTDGNHEFMVARPVVGQYYGGDAQYLTDIAGNGTRWEITDAVGEFSIYSPRYFRLEAPGALTAIFADMQNGTMKFNTNNLLIRDIGDSATYFSINPPSSVGGFGDWSNLATGATVAVDWAIGGSKVTLTGNSSNGTQFFVDGLNQEVKARLDGHFSVVDVTNAIPAIDLDTVNKLGQFGWVSGTGVNGNYLYIDDANHDSRFVTDGAGYFSVKGGSNILFQVNTPSGLITSGDISNATTRAKAIIDISNKQFRFSTGGTDRFIAYEDWVLLGGAVVFGSIQTYTSTGSVTMNNNVSTLVYDPASVNATATITLPTSSGGSGSTVTILFGGTITSGNPVVTALTIAPGSGNTIVDSNIPTTALAGDSLSYRKIGAYWYRID